MMTKAAFFMQEHLRRNFAYITDVNYPTAFFCRGRLPFPQGLSAIAILFHNKTPADVYAHPYFVEKQSDPSQPSPQLHITEEIQGIIKVQRGLRYMKDDSSKLDDTMSVVTDYDVPVRGSLLYVQTSGEQEEARLEEERRREEQNRSLQPDRGAGSRQRRRAATSEPTITFSSSLPGDEDRSATAAATRHPQEKGEVTPEERAALHQRRIASRAFVSSFMHSGARSGGPSPGRMGGPGAAGSSGGSSLFGGGDVEGGVSRRSSVGSSVGLGGGTGLTAPPAPNAPMLFPSVGESLKDKAANLSFFKSVLNQRVDERAVSAPIPPPQVHLHDDDSDGAGLFKERIGGFTVVYNPVETNDRTFADLMAKLNEEEKVVKVIVVPTRHAWRQVQVWADAFPDAQIISSGPIPLLREDGTTTSTDQLSHEQQEQQQQPHTSHDADTASAVHGGATGMQDFGNGVMGMSFPEVDLEAVQAAERAEQERREQQQEVRRERRRRAASQEAAMAAAVSPTHDATTATPVATSSARAAAMREEREALQRQGEETEGSGASDRLPAPRPRSSNVEDPADFLWSQQARQVTSSAGFAGDGGADLHGYRQGGLRIADAHRVRDLSREGNPDFVQLTPSILLFHVKGDDVTNEFVMYDYSSKTLYCTDLFHGQYADLDPLNSWMCRVWFKFMKQGNHKRVDVVPRFKWRQVCGQGSLHEVQRFVDWVTTCFEINNIVQSHGTPPFTEDAANALRLQWDLAPLPPRSHAQEGSDGGCRGAEPRTDTLFDWEKQQQLRDG